MSLLIKNGLGTNTALKTTLEGDEHITHHIVEGVATAANQVLEITKLTEILAKLIAAPATAANQETEIEGLGLIITALGGLATQATQASILAKIIAAPSTEAKQDAAITLLTTLAGKDFATQTTLASVLAKMIAAPATEAKQDTLIAKDFATQATLALMSAKLPAALGQATKANSLSATLASDQDALTVIGSTINIQYELTRPADTTTYTANDVIANATSGAIMIPFAAISRINQGSGYITKIRCVTDQKACVARLRLHIFNVSNIAQQDNAAYALTYANFVSKIGVVDLPPFSTEDATASNCAEAMNADIRLAFKCAAASSALYVIAETRDGFSPANAQKFYFEMSAENN